MKLWSKQQTVLPVPGLESDVGAGVHEAKVSAEVQWSLATVVIGGILTSTLLTLVVLPVLYSLAGRRPNV